LHCVSAGPDDRTAARWNDTNTSELNKNNTERKDLDMRSILMASAAILIASSAPSMARDYAWCARTITNPDFGDCSFTSYRQCMATVSGQAGECISNPRLAYGQMNRWQRNAGGYRTHDRQDGPGPDVPQNRW
jgi:hypothetical protein